MFGSDIFSSAKIDDTQSLLEVIETLDLNKKDQNSESLLHYTVKFNSIEFARVLLSHGANVNIKNNNGDTPLMISCKMGKEGFIKLLLRYGADINAINNFGETALHMSILNGNLDVIKLLINENSNIRALTDSNRSIAHYAVKSGKLQVVKYIIEHYDVHINEKDGTGCTMLHYACSINSFEIVNYLVKMNASLHVRNNQGETPLFYAAKSSSLNIVDFLIENGAIAECENIFNEKISDVARDDILMYLDFLAYNMQYQKRLQDYPLHAAVLKCDYNEVQRLIELGKRNNKKDVFGKTPIDYAIETADKKMISILLSKKAI